MKNIRYKKIFFTYIIFLYCIMLGFFSKQSLAADIKKLMKIIFGETSITTIQGKQERFYFDFKTDDYKPDSTTDTTGTTKIANKGNSIVKVVRVIGTSISVIVLMCIAIKYMVGSVEEKAEYKKTMMPYVIGCFLVFGITNILAIIVDITSGIL